MKVSLTTHSAPAKRQCWSAVEVKIDLASKAADFICDARHCQGGMFYAGKFYSVGGAAQAPRAAGTDLAPSRASSAW